MIHVAVGVIFNDKNQILIAKRPDDKHQGGLWEFPGGKVEQGEAVLQALSRELQEEVGIDLVSAMPMMKYSYDYPDITVALDVWAVNEFEGTPKGLENQLLCWVDKQELGKFSFPLANEKILLSLAAA